MAWLKHFFTRHRRFDELSESIREHLDEKIADLMDRGMTREQAESAARREFGNVTRIEERSREVWQWSTLESFVADIKFALRQLRKSPGPALISVLSLTLGIGATTAIFSIVDCVVLRPLPYAGANRMVHIDIFDRSGDRGYALLSGEQFAQLRHVKALDGAVAEDNWVMTITTRVCRRRFRRISCLEMRSAFWAFRLFWVGSSPNRMLLSDKSRIILQC
jgi:hypothetical protein